VLRQRVGRTAGSLPNTSDRTSPLISPSRRWRRHTGRHPGPAPRHSGRRRAGPPPAGVSEQDASPGPAAGPAARASHTWQRPRTWHHALGGDPGGDHRDVVPQPVCALQKARDSQGDGSTLSAEAGVWHDSRLGRVCRRPMWLRAAQPAFGELDPAQRTGIVPGDGGSSMSSPSTSSPGPCHIQRISEGARRTHLVGSTSRCALRERATDAGTRSCTPMSTVWSPPGGLTRSKSPSGCGCRRTRQSRFHRPLGGIHRRMLTRISRARVFLFGRVTSHDPQGRCP
jgi:hypothetical protein